MFLLYIAEIVSPPNSITVPISLIVLTHSIYSWFDLDADKAWAVLGDISDRFRLFQETPTFLLVYHRDIVGFLWFVASLVKIFGQNDAGHKTEERWTEAKPFEDATTTLLVPNYHFACTRYYLRPETRFLWSEFGRGDYTRIPADTVFVMIPHTPVTQSSRQSDFPLAEEKFQKFIANELIYS